MFEEEADEEARAERLARLLENFRKYRPANLSDPGELHPDVEAWGKRLLTGEAGNLLLRGPVGTGKTWAAWEVLDRAIRAGYADRIVFSSSADWRETIAPPVDRDRLRVMRECGVLTLDDLGSGRVNDWELEMLLALCDERWSNRRPIVVTSNVMLKTMLGERIASRIADRATIVQLDGRDRRSGR